MKIHATYGERRHGRVDIGGGMRIVLRVAQYRSACGRWMLDDDRWADTLADVTCAACRRVLVARGEVAS